jgi:hypothetical protein
MVGGTFQEFPSKVIRKMKELTADVVIRNSGRIPAVHKDPDSFPDLPHDQQF